MCDPLTIGSIAVTGLGTMMQMRSQEKAQRSMDNVLRENASEAERLQKDSQGRTLKAAEEFGRDKFDQNVADETAKTKKQFIDAQSGGVPGEYYGDSVSDNTKRYQEKKSSEASDYTKRMAAALATMRGFEGGMRAGNTQSQRASEQVAMNNNFMAGNNAILPLRLEAAKAKGSNPLADIMVGIGSAGLSAGLSGGSGPMTTSLAGGDKIIWNTGRNGVPYSGVQKFFGGLA